MGNEFKEIEAVEGSLGELLAQVQIEQSANGLDKVRSILALRMNQYQDIKITSKDAKAIQRSFLDIEVGSSTGLVMICSYHKCLYKNRCGLYKAKKAPEGKECLHENKVLTDSMDRYLHTFDIKIDNYAEMVLVNQLCEYEIIEHRCNAILSNANENMKMESVIGVDEDGQIITKEEVSHALTIKMQVFKNKMLLLQEFTATRKEKYKKQAALKIAGEGPAKMISTMKSQILKNKSETVAVEEVKQKLELDLNTFSED